MKDMGKNGFISAIATFLAFWINIIKKKFVLPNVEEPGDK